MSLLLDILTVVSVSGALLKAERPRSSHERGLRAVYASLIAIMSLRRVG